MSTIANPLPLGPEVTIAHAGAWHEALAGALAQRGGDLALDLEGVTDFDSSGVQLLLATRRSLVERGDALVVHRASAAVRDALTRFGLAEMLPAATA
ncbi:MAG: STAS domain-containing protein [Burkholderiales bacterium]|nr:STAS domain-containing protein [Burkholderiales bacterium]